MLRAELEFSNRDRWIGIVFLLGVGLLTVLDVAEDTLDGASLLHTSTEGLIIVTCLIGAFTIWRRSLAGLKARNLDLLSKLSQVTEALDHWRQKTSLMTQNYHAAIAQQLKDWQLTPAEQEVAFLLLKGLSVKEIATVRQTAERTVRQQSTAIYQKSKLEGRAQLSAFFLDDLLEAPKAVSK